MTFIRTILRSIRCVSTIERVAALAMLYVVALSGHAQDLETIKDEKALRVNGGISTNTTFYHAEGIDNRRDPFYWMLSANLNFNLFGIIQAPFSMTLSQQQKSFSQPQPFNRFGISPRYKSVTAHLGHRTMNFSEYTLAGNMFLGAGVEVTPENSFVRVSAMYGRLAKAVERAAQEGLVFAKPTYQRVGYGMKLGLGRKKHMVDLILFKAEDDENSIEVTEELDVMPEENLVTAVHSQHQVGDRLAVEFEYAYSLFTRDKRLTESREEGYSFVNNLGGLFRPNLSSEFNNALTLNMNYNADRYQAMLKYRKIDPGYRTLGAAFLNNGLQDITGGLSWGMLQQKVNVALNSGFQKTSEATSIVRVIYSANVSFTNNKRLSIVTNYSNFSTTTRQTQLQTDVLTDTLEFFQVTRSGAVNMNYKVGKPEGGNMLVLSANVQDASDNNGNASTFYNLALGSQWRLGEAWQAGLTGSYNQNMTSAVDNTSTGPVLNVNRSFLKGAIRMAMSAAMLRSYQSGVLRSEVLNASWTNSFRILKRHNVAVNLYYLDNQSRGEQARQFSEIRAMINYNYSF